MTVSDLYDLLLSNKEFQDPGTGNLFFPAYVYTYDPADEYAVRCEILSLKERLKRPNNFIDTLILNVFDEFIEFLQTTKLGNESILNLIYDKERSDDLPEEITRDLKLQAQSREFFEFINNKAEAHFNLPSKFKKVYLMLYGFGAIFPYLRTSIYLKNFEEHVTGYKLIVFFPGKYENQNYSLFNEFNDENVYRAVLINP
jgi:hypothetical protein